MEIRGGGKEIAQTQWREQRAVDLREAKYEIAIQKEGTGCKNAWALLFTCLVSQRTLLLGYDHIGIESF